MEAALNRKQERRPCTVMPATSRLRPHRPPTVALLLAMVNNKGCSTTPSPPAQHPGMLYSAPSQPQQVFLGFVTTSTVPQARTSIGWAMCTLSVAMGLRSGLVLIVATMGVRKIQTRCWRKIAAIRFWL